MGWLFFTLVFKHIFNFVEITSYFSVFDPSLGCTRIHFYYLHTVFKKEGKKLTSSYMNCNVRADFPTPPLPTMMTLCKAGVALFVLDILPSFRRSKTPGRSRSKLKGQCSSFIKFGIFFNHSNAHTHCYIKNLKF